MESREILLGQSKHKLGVNEENFLNVELQSYEKVLPYTEDAFHVDAYQQYFKEKDASEKYRLAFTITPFCSNVLFNVLTEPVFLEGSSACTVATSGLSIEPPEGFEFVYKTISDKHRSDLIMDTGFSHKKTNKKEEPVVYHCGYDIFDNHFLRKKEFNVVNKTKNYASPEERFNTIEDTLRNYSGDVENEKRVEIIGGTLNNRTGVTHLYQYDTLYSYSDSVFNNLVENNGWFGFLNPCTIAIDNAKDASGNTFSINKCMNDNNAWEQIDMYPDRSLFSFVPKINKHRGRIEKNWDYCVTYPAYSDSEHPMVAGGLRCKIDTDIKPGDFENEDMLVTFKSFTRHNLSADGYVILSFNENGSNGLKTTNPVKVVSLGKSGYDSEHYFSVRLASIMNEVAVVAGNRVISLKNNQNFKDIRLKKFENGGEAQYYLRIFKKFPDHMANSLNKLSFSQNIYSDQVAQIVYTDDFITSAITDNLGRPISELFLTIVKRNAGRDLWYSRNAFASSSVEFSHAFGEVTSGFDLPEDEECKDYNVRRIHSIDDNAAADRGITPSPKKLETDITIDEGGHCELLDMMREVSNEEIPPVLFYGDIVEFIPSRMQETVIEDVYHRFNTAQREATNNAEYRNLVYHEIVHDDYDIGERVDSRENTPFSVEEFQLGGNNVNLVPEGYYYKPHYRVLVKEFEDTVNQGNHIAIAYSSMRRDANNQKIWHLTTSKNYYFEAPVTFNGEVISEGSKVYARKINDGKFSEISGTCISVEGKHFTEVTIQMSDTTDIKKGGYKLYRENTEMPAGAYELEDGSGRYLWRNILSYADMTPDNELYDEIFTNGAHYHHLNIMFYLRRQDPYGVYGIGNEPEDLAGFISVSGKTHDVTYAEYVEEGRETIC